MSSSNESINERLDVVFVFFGHVSDFFDAPQYKSTKKSIPGGAPQTFFPSTWSKDKILEQCASALANPKKRLVPGKSRMWEAESGSGVFMRWFEDDAGNIKSIFPEF